MEGGYLAILASLVFFSLFCVGAAYCRFAYFFNALIASFYQSGCAILGGCLGIFKQAIKRLAKKKAIRQPPGGARRMDGLDPGKTFDVTTTIIGGPTDGEGAAGSPPSDGIRVETRIEWDVCIDDTGEYKHKDALQIFTTPVAGAPRPRFSLVVQNVPGKKEGGSVGPEELV